MRIEKLSVLMLCCLAGCGRPIEGRLFPNEGALTREFRGYAVLGRFGKHWPATVVRVEESRDGAEVRLRDGTVHSYTGLSGRTVRTVHLESGGRETVVVLRSDVQD